MNKSCRNLLLFSTPLMFLGALFASGIPDVASAPVNLVPTEANTQLKSSHPDIVKIRKKRRRTSSRKKRSSKRAPVATATALRKSAILGKHEKNELLFGTTEKRSSKFKAFKKWQGVMERMAKEQSDVASFKKRFSKWTKFLDGLKGKDRLTQVKAVNKFMNKSKYIQDKRNWGKKDYWASPGEFLTKFGDCEDYSIAKYMALKYLGIAPDKLRIVAVKDMNLKVGHAILAYYAKDRILILDNQIKIVADSRKIRHYQPVYSINEKFWWRHRAA